MKIRNIAFGGFMASILMAGAAYAETLATQGYVDSAYLTNKGAITTHTSNADIHVTKAQKDAWDAKQDAGDYATNDALDTAKSDLTSAIATAKSEAITTAGTNADTKIANKVGTIGDKTVKAYVDDIVNGLSGGDVATLKTDVSALQSAMTTAQGDITTLKSDMTTAKGNITALQTAMTTAQGDIETLESADTALDERLDTAEATITSHGTAIDTLTGTGAGSVSKAVNDAISAEVTRADGAYATAAQGELADTAIQQAGLDSAISAHNVSTSAHADIREGIAGNAANIAANAEAIEALQIKKCETSYCYVNGSGAYVGFDMTGAWTEPTPPTSNPS